MDIVFGKERICGKGKETLAIQTNRNSVMEKLKYILPTQRILLTKCRKERKQFYYGISIKPYCSVCTAGSPLRLIQRQKEILPHSLP